MRLLPALALSLVVPLLPAAPAAADAFPDTVPLPAESAPEGIAGGPGTTFYAGSRVDGSIVRGDLRTGDSDPFVGGEPGGIAVGMLHDPASGLLWVAGGPTGRVTAYDGETGAQVYRATAPAAAVSPFLNDVAVTPDAVYVTDSRNARLVVVPLGPGGRPDGPAQSLPLTGFTQPSGFGLNGLRVLPGGDLVAVSSAGGLFRIAPDGTTTTLLTGQQLASGDGLVLLGSTLYVVNAVPDGIGVVRLTPAGAQVLGTLTDDDLDRPTTATAAAGALWVVNGRFAQQNAPGTTYDVVRVAR